MGSVGGDSDVEELVEGLQHLDFHAGADSHSDSESQASTAAQSVPRSVPSSYSRSRAQPPCAGPHSKPQPRKPRDGAKDVWTFFTVVKGKRECVLCQ